MLVAEDRLCQTLMRKMLPKMGFDATLVDNGGAVIEACCTLAPGSDGAWQLLYALRWLSARLLSGAHR